MRRVVIEGGVIVVSILLALAVDAWWEDRNDRQLEAEYVSRLHDELGRGLPTLERFLGATGAARALPMLGEWSRDRALPKPSPRTFRELWLEGIE